MKYRSTFTPTIKVILWIMVALSLAGVVVGILTLTGTPLDITPAQGTLLISVCSFTLIVAILLATIHYKVGSEYLRLNIAFVDVLSGRIRIDKILNIVIDGDKMYISYLWKGPDPVIAQIAISPKKFESMKNELMSKNRNIVFYENKDNGTTDSEQQ